MKQNKSDKENLTFQPSNSSSEVYKVVPTPTFLNQAADLYKKYPNIKEDFLALAEILKKDPITGNDHVMKDVWKVRMVISDKNQGQSGGARVIIEVKVMDTKVYVLSVYDKSVREDLTDDEVKKLMNKEKPSPKQKTSSSNKAYKLRKSYKKK